MSGSELRVGSAPAGRSHMQHVVADHTEDIAQSGYLNRKTVQEARGKKSKDRSWQTLWCSLRGSTLEFYRVDGIQPKGQGEPPPRDVYPPPNTVKYKVGFVELEGAQVKLDFVSQMNKDLHKRRQHLFRVTLQNSLEYLMQAPSDNLKSNWVVALQSAAQQKLDLSDSAGTKIKAARCSIKNRSRTNVHSMKRHPFMTSQALEDSVASEPQEIFREDPRLAVIKRRLQDKKTLCRQISKMYTSFMGGTAAMYCDMQMHFDTSPGSNLGNDGTTLLPPMTRSKVVHRRMSLPESQHLRAGGGGGVGEGDDRRASTGEMAVPIIEPASPGGFSDSEGFETELLLDYYLVPGAKWSQLKQGEMVRVLGKCGNGWYRCMAGRSASFEIEDTTTMKEAPHEPGEMSLDSGAPPSEGLSSTQSLRTVQEDSAEVANHGEVGSIDELDSSLQLSFNELDSTLSTIRGSEDENSSFHKPGITKLGVTLKRSDQNSGDKDDKLAVVLRKKDHRKSCERPLSYQLATEELSVDFEEQIKSSPERNSFSSPSHHSTPSRSKSSPLSERSSKVQRDRSESQPLGTEITGTLLKKLRDARLNDLVQSELETGSYCTPLVGCIPPSALKYFAEKDASLKALSSSSPSHPSPPSPPSPPSQHHSDESNGSKDTDSDHKRGSFACSEDSVVASSFTDSGNFESSSSLVSSSILSSSLIGSSIAVARKASDSTCNQSVNISEEMTSSTTTATEVETSLELSGITTISIEIDDADAADKDKQVFSSMDSNVVTFDPENAVTEESLVSFRRNQSRAQSLPPPTITPTTEQAGSERCYDDEAEMDGESSLDRCSRSVRALSSHPEGTTRSHSLNAQSVMRATQSAHTSPARKPGSSSSSSSSYSGGNKKAAITGSSSSSSKHGRKGSHDLPSSSSSASQYSEPRPSLLRKLFTRRRSGKTSPSPSPSHAKQSHYVNLPPADNFEDAPLPYMEEGTSPGAVAPMPLALKLKAVLGEDFLDEDSERARVSSVSGRVVRKAGVGLVFGDSSSESEDEEDEDDEEEEEGGELAPSPSPLGYRDDSVFSSPTFEQHGARLKRNRSAENIHRLTVSPDNAGPSSSSSSAYAGPPISRMKKSASEHDSLKLKAATVGTKDTPPSIAVSLRRNLTFNNHFRMPTLLKDTKQKKSKTLKKLRTLRKKSSIETISSEEPDSATKLTGIFRSPPRGEKRYVYLDPLETKYGFRLQSYGRLQDKGKVLQTFVENVQPGSPSFMAGLYPGDAILEVNGQDVKYAPVEEVVKVITSFSKSNNYNERIQLVVEFVDGVTRLNCMKTADELKTQMRAKQTQLRKLLSSETNSSNRYSTGSSASSSSLPSPSAVVQPEDLSSWVHSNLTFMPGARPFSHNRHLNSVISLHKGGITALACDVLVIPISSCCKAGGSTTENVLLQLLQTGGEDLRNELSLAKQCRLGQNIVTSGHRLHAKKIYHCVFGDLEESLQGCCTKALEAASDEQLRRIAFWMDGFVSIQVSPHLVIEAVRQWFQQGNNYNKFDHIIFSATVNLEIISMFLDKYFPLREYESGSDYSLEMVLQNGTGTGLAPELKIQNAELGLGNGMDAQHGKISQISVQDIGLEIMNSEDSISPCGTSILESESDGQDIDSDLGDNEPTPKIAKKSDILTTKNEAGNGGYKFKPLSTIFSASATSDCVLNEDSEISSGGGNLVPLSDSFLRTPPSPLVLNPDRIESEV